MKKLWLLSFLTFNVIIATHSKKVLVFGSQGWIGGKLVALLEQQGHIPIRAQSRLENRQAIIQEIQETKPDCIINSAGIIGKPNVDWCEDHKQETIRTNVIGTLNLADIAFLNNLHLTNISTGCIYEYDELHPMHSGKGFTEDDEPNFKGSFYSRTKIAMENLILEYPNVLNLRVKMPISAEFDRGFVGKIKNYKKVINVPNSFCVLEDLLPIAIDMTIKGITGNYNFVNPGTLSHNQVLDLYKEYIDPTLTYENFTLEEQDKILKARRANAELNPAKLLQLYTDIPCVKDSFIRLLNANKVK